MDIRIISAAFIIGIFVSDFCGVINMLLFAGSAAVILFIRAIFKKKIPLMLMLAVLSFVLGGAAYKSAALTEFDDTGKFLGRETVIEGYICDIPYKQYDMMKYTLNATEINNEKVNEKIIVSAKESYKFGDSVLLYGTLKPLKEQMNEGGYNAVTYYKAKGITARITAKISQTYADGKKHFSAAYLANSARNKVSQIIDTYYSGDRAATLKAVLAGNFHFLSEETSSLLTRTSVRSLFYPAYVHIMLINIFVGAFSSIVKKSKRDIFTAVLFVLYALINTDHPSFLRGFLFGTAALGSERIFKRVYYPSVFAAAILVTAALNPMLVFNSGYVMSVSGAVLVKALYAPAAKLLKIQTLPKRIIIMQIICTIGLLPLSAYYFNSVSPYSVFASLIILPAVAAVLVVSPFFLGLLAFTGKAYAAGHIMSALTSVLMLVPKIIDKLPCSRVFIKTPSSAALAAFIFATAALAYKLHGREKPYRIFLSATAVFAAICAVSFVLKRDTAEVDFVNVGQGDAAVIHTFMGANVLIDGGGSAEYSEYNIGEKVFVPYLTAIGASKIDAAFLTHYHKDHAQGIAAAVENLEVKNLFLPLSLPESEVREELEQLAEENNTDIYYIEENTKITFGDGLTFDITVPDTETQMSKEENDTSLLINVSYGEFNCLFTGDMTKTAEKNLVRKNKVPRAEVLKVSHHGSKRSTCEEFYERVSPEYSVISVGEDNTYGHPNKETLDRISNSQVLRTDINGDIRIISDKKGNIKIHTFK